MNTSSVASTGIFTTISEAGPFGIILLLFLTFLSFATWALIIERWRSLNSLYQKSEEFLKTFWEAKSLSELNQKIKDLDYSPAREIFRNGYNEMVRVVQARDKKGGAALAMPFDTVKRALTKARFIEESMLAKNMNYLAISASACPFIGLFGTVIGVIRAFQDIGSSGSASLAAVAPGISEALVATALGLAAAIPAVIFYNYFVSQAKSHLVLLDGFSSDFLNILERHFNVAKLEVPASSSHNTSSALKTEE